MQKKRPLTQPSCLLPSSHWLLAMLLVLSISAQAFADNLIVLSRQLDSYQQVADTLSERLPSPSKTITLAQLEQENVSSQGFENVIAVGSKAAQRLFPRLENQQKLFVTFLPRATYKKLLDKYEGHRRIKERKVTAVFLDQPYQRQLALARLIVPRARTIATALGPHSQSDLDELEQAAEKHQLTLLSETLKETDNPIHKLQPLIRGADLFLALPDKSVFNRTTAKWILYITFRQRIPLLGFSKKYVEAGALAAVYSSPEDIGKQTAELIISAEKSALSVKGEYPRHYSVITNPTAANSLRLQIPSEQSLKQRLMEME